MAVVYLSFSFYLLLRILKGIPLRGAHTMPSRCAADHCKATAGPGCKQVLIRRHSAEVVSSWFKQIRPRYTEDDLRKDLGVCHVHFPEGSFVFGPTGRATLVAGAIPYTRE
eukprot:comp24347_c0_seq10/m.46486 comp24347_c0_seq10/g.46486  ORF comp24347_c0_seq10/g.46486 comp24347_c0_seq10/m.46486 type:complete len:111 (-) comp24347_c0_seq10:112-444(-)